MDKSYDDEWWNLAEHIWNLMVAKLETIQATIPWNDIVPEIARVWNWKIAENFISENNSPILNKSAKSVRLGSWNPSELLLSLEIILLDLITMMKMESTNQQREDNRFSLINPLFKIYKENNHFLKIVSFIYYRGKVNAFLRVIFRNYTCWT